MLSFANTMKKKEWVPTKFFGNNKKAVPLFSKLKLDNQLLLTLWTHTKGREIPGFRRHDPHPLMIRYVEEYKLSFGKFRNGICHT
jgi:hypothetical protein